MRLAELRSALTRNLGLRAVALLLATILWLFVNAGNPQAESSLKIPVQYVGLQPGLMITNFHPDSLELQISGPRTLLSLLNPERLTLRLDLRGIGPGQAHFDITPAEFSLPRQTAISRISPSEINLNIDQVVSRQLPVQLMIDGEVAAGYGIGSIALSPPSVTVTGPSHDVSALKSIATEPFVVKGATKEVTQTIRLFNPGGLLKVSTDEVLATVTVHEIVADREFRGLPVKVRDARYRFSLQPRKVDAKVRGPARGLAALDLSGSAYVDAASTTLPGVYNLPVMIDLPEGFELVDEKPDNVRFRMYRSRARESAEP
jgi:YbbR domain-containing protein